MPKWKQGTYQTLQKQKITPEEKERWDDMLHRTWQAIGNDVEVAMEGSGHRLKSADVIEICLDAHHPCTYGGMTLEEYNVLGATMRNGPVKKWLRAVLNY